MLVGTPGFQQIKVGNMKNVGRHTWISGYIAVKNGKCW